MNDYFWKLRISVDVHQLSSISVDDKRIIASAILETEKSLLLYKSYNKLLFNVTEKVSASFLSSSKCFGNSA